VSEERRQYSRISFASPAQLLLGKRAFEVQVLDLSLKGALNLGNADLLQRELAVLLAG